MRGRERREGIKEGKSSPCLGVKETNNKRIWRAYMIILLFLPFSLLKSIHCVILCNLSCKLCLSLIGTLNYYEGKLFLSLIGTLFDMIGPSSFSIIKI